MLLKIDNDDNIIIPNELSSVIYIIKKIIAFEKQINRDIKLWNIRILMDIRPINKQVVPIYEWTNKLPTLFYIKEIETTDLEIFDNKNKVNLSIYSHMKANYEYHEYILINHMTLLNLMGQPCMLVILRAKISMIVFF